MPPDVLPEAPLPDLDSRPVCGHDLRFVQQWFKLTVPEACYLLGITLNQWTTYTRQADQPLADPSVALLVWALLRFPETRYVPTFPEPAEVYPLYQQMAAQSTKSLASQRHVKLRKVAFSVLLGRDKTSTHRWLSETHPRPAAPATRRLLFALRNVLIAHGVPGLDTWVERAETEAQARQLHLSSMTSWFRMPGHAVSRTPKQPAAGPPRPRGRPKRRLPPTDESEA